MYNWDLNLSELARVWTNGCIIKSNLMKDLVETLKATDNLLNDQKFIQQIKEFKSSTNKVVAACVLYELTVSCFSDSVQFFNGITTANSSANIIQAQRDLFGAHTYQRTDDISGKFHHTNWES